MTTHPHDDPRPSGAPTPADGATIVLNNSMFGRELTKQHFANLLGAAARASAGEDESSVRRAVEEAIDRSALDIPPVQVERFVEQLVRGRGLARISDDTGAVLFEV